MKRPEKNSLRGRGRRPTAGILFCAACGLLCLLCWTSQAMAQWPRIAVSKDGTPISYEVFGSGEPTLVFVHGWSCDGRYFRMQVPLFSQKHRVIVLDLAGHGHSGASRQVYSMRSFGEDVRAVVEAEKASKVILIGHSMGGSVIAEAARLMQGQVIGLIGVDTLNNIEYPLSRKEFEEMIAPLRKDFRQGTRAFVAPMLLPDADPALRDWILADMSSAPPSVALSAMEQMMNLYIIGKAAKIFKDVSAPVVCVNADLWPVNTEANRKHMRSFDVIVIPKADHFLMMNRPADFNAALEKAVGMILEKTVKSCR